MVNTSLIISNDLIENKRTSWKDKYTTSLYSTLEVNCRRFELQPIPGYIRWYKTGEMHYLPMEERALLLGPWDNITGIFLPSKIVDLCFTVVQVLNDELTNLIALLSWIPPVEVKAYYHKIVQHHAQQEKVDREK